MAKRIRFRTSPHNKNVNHGPNVPQTQIIGPFPGNTTPSRPGPFKRTSPVTGKLLWSFWNGSYWGMSGKNFDRAIQRKAKRSSEQSLPWFGITAPATK